MKFTTPIIVQGKVYAGTGNGLVAYGELTPAAAPDVSAQTKVKPRTANITANEVKQKVTIINDGPTPLAGPVSLVIDGLGKKFTVANAAGTTSLTSPRASFYLNAVPAGATLAPGAAATVKVKFASVKHVAPTFTTRVLAGAGGALTYWTLSFLSTALHSTRSWIENARACHLSVILSAARHERSRRTSALVPPRPWRHAGAKSSRRRGPMPSAAPAEDACTHAEVLRLRYTPLRMTELAGRPRQDFPHAKSG